MPRATTAASAGMIQTAETRARLLGTTVASGRSSRCGVSAMALPPARARIPDEAAVEGIGRRHREDDDGREEQDARPRLDRHQRLELDQGDRERVDEDVQHRPAPDELDHAVEPGPLAVAP